MSETLKLNAITFIGGGHMATALIGGLYNAGFDTSKITVSDPNTKQCAELQHAYNVRTLTDNDQACRDAELVILAVKPQIMPDVLTSIQHCEIPLLVSVAAGLRIETLAATRPATQAVIRVMPNTPAAIGAGATVLVANAACNTEQRALAEAVMRTAGEAYWLEDEALMNCVTALSGSGPAYFFYIMEALTNAAIKQGLSAELAKALTLQTALGAAKMAKASPHSIADLRHNVTSPGGTTAAALAVLEKTEVGQHLQDALNAALQRGEELS